MRAWTRLRMWRYRRIPHHECAENQLRLWRGGEAPHGACTECHPRMLWMREAMTPSARIARPAPAARAWAWLGNLITGSGGKTR